MLEIMKTGNRNSWKWSVAIIDRNKVYPVSKEVLKRVHQKSMVFLYCAKSNNGLRYCLLVTYGTIFYKNSRTTPQLTYPQPNIFYSFIDSRHCTKSSLLYSWTLTIGRSIFALPLASLPAWILQSSLWNCLHNVRGNRRGVQQNVPTHQQIPRASITPQIFMSAVETEHADRIILTHWWGKNSKSCWSFVSSGMWCHVIWRSK